jgi:hypothetical protein
MEFLPDMIDIVCEIYGLLTGGMMMMMTTTKMATSSV